MNLKKSPRKQSKKTKKCKIKVKIRNRGPVQEAQHLNNRNPRKKEQEKKKKNGEKTINKIIQGNLELKETSFWV